MIRRPPRSTLFPYTTPSDLRRAVLGRVVEHEHLGLERQLRGLTRDRVEPAEQQLALAGVDDAEADLGHARSEEHTSELQSRQYLVCRLLLEKKKKKLQICIL